jgi:orotidine-5'-phosphate decarboxylase
VASPKETARIRGICGPKFQIINPGIRMPDAKKDDQVRVGTVEKAIEGGASFLVVGRPILKAENRLNAALMFLDEIDRVIALQAEC